MYVICIKISCRNRKNLKWHAQILEKHCSSVQVLPESNDSSDVVLQCEQRLLETAKAICEDDNTSQRNKTVGNLI